MKEEKDFRAGLIHPVASPLAGTLPRPDNECEVYKAALNRIASWSEGDTVTSSFDEPGSAAIAREALRCYRGESASVKCLCEITFGGHALPCELHPK
jgi:hypothetical protein